MSSYSGSFKKNLAVPSRHSNARSESLPPANHAYHSNQKHGELILPDNHLKQLQICFQALWSYLTYQGQTPELSNSASLKKLQVLTTKQIIELTTDVCDEIERRLPEFQGRPAESAYLPPRSEYVDTRNESRQKLATLRNVWFQGLVCDIWTECRRRHPQFTKFETLPAREEEQHDEAEDDNIDDTASDVPPPPPPPSQDQSRRKQSTNSPANPGYFDDSRTDFEQIDVADEISTWLADAEEKVKSHLGEGRCAHDYLHADRLRKQAVALAKSCQKRGQKIDLKVTEVAALFTSAINDPKYPVKDPKEFVLPYTEAHAHQFDSQQAEKIARIASTVGLRRDERRRKEGRQTDFHKTCLELHCVQDADKLEQVGAIGILRASATFGTTHKPLYNTGPSHHSGESIAGTAIHNAMEKSRILPLMMTPEGKAAAAKRIERMKNFQEELAQELFCVGL